ncbi:hypothetical protein AGMMS49928_25960 [Spirochaetia bacterium]|nr:hypothetical protein AGMMS49928_25960 [Spirochaetia bacterium]
MDIVKNGALPPPLRGTLLRYHISGNMTQSVPSTGAEAIDSWTFEELFSLAHFDTDDRAAFDKGGELMVHGGGWQSWSAGWELAGRENLPRKLALYPELLKQINRDGECPPPEGHKKDWITGHFIAYIRSGDRYLCIASAEGSGEPPEGCLPPESCLPPEGCLPPESCLPPVGLYINRKKRIVQAEIFAPGKIWLPNEKAAELYIFIARGFFNFKDALKKLYHQEENFASIDFLRVSPGESLAACCKNIPGGYESWYNHYTNINEDLILEDLDGLAKTENLLKLRYISRKKPLVFQIDDGWEKAVGEWDIDPLRFPGGLKPLAEKIESAGMIPGLWLAPFLVTRRSRIFREKPEWLLRALPREISPRHRPSNQLVAAGFNPLWDKQFYCLDISRQDVLNYLEELMDKVINQWGFRYIKLDFLYAGFFFGAFTWGLCPQASPQGSPYEHYEKACAILTSRKKTASGLPVAYLGCGVPLGPSHRHFPLSRIGADTREEWDWKAAKLLGYMGRPSAWINLRDTIGRSFLDGTVYLNDPDVVFLRSKNCTLSENEKELIALVNFLLAGQIMFSDDPLHLDEKDLAITGRINLLYEKLEDDEYGAVRIDKDVFRLESRSGKISGIINLQNRRWALKKTKEPELWQKLQAPSLLVDHRLGGKSSGNPEKIFFEKHSISIGRS